MDYRLLPGRREYSNTFSPPKDMGCLNESFANWTLIGITDSHSYEQIGILDEPGVVYVDYRQRGRAIVEKRTDQERLMYSALKMTGAP